MAFVTFVLPDGVERRVEASPGDTLLDVARSHAIDIEGACGGAMACATCHLHVPREWFERLDAASPEEEDMLDLANEWQPTSRLGCQIRISNAIGGLVVHVPRSTLLG